MLMWAYKYDIAKYFEASVKLDPREVLCRASRRESRLLVGPMAGACAGPSGPPVRSVLCLR